MEIACNIDHRFIKYCVVMLVSLFENNKDEKFGIHIVADDLQDKDKQLMQESLQKYGHQLHFYDVSPDLLKGYPISSDSHITLSTYYRLFLPNILSKEIHKIIYLDCDLVVRGSIRNLWDIDISQYAIGCVEDMLSSGMPQQDRPADRLHYNPTDSYFNAGVLVVNLDYWREHNIVHQCMEYIEKYPERLQFYDQDVLNAVLHNQKLFIPFIWNMQEGFYRRRRRINKNTWAELDQAMMNPTILHYTGKKKPWISDCRHPLKEEWFKYLDMTRWKGERPATNYLEEMNYWLFKLGVLLKVDKPKYRKLK